jgi:hypothetical protein
MFCVVDDDDDVDVVAVKHVVPVVTETVTVRRVEQGESDESTSSSWDTEGLLSYVADQIQRLHGPFPRDARREKAVMQAFLNRWGDQAAPIARYAFEVAGGMWRGAPISISRFGQGSDKYFGAVIVEQLS